MCDLLQEKGPLDYSISNVPIHFQLVSIIFHANFILKHSLINLNHWNSVKRIQGVVPLNFLWDTIFNGEFHLQKFSSFSYHLRVFRGDPRKSCSKNFEIFLVNIRSLQSFTKNGLQQRFYPANSPKFYNSANFVLLKDISVTVKLLCEGMCSSCPPVR